MRTVLGKPPVQETLGSAGGLLPPRVSQRTECKNLLRKGFWRRVWRNGDGHLDRESLKQSDGQKVTGPEMVQRWGRQIRCTDICIMRGKVFRQKMGGDRGNVE